MELNHAGKHVRGFNSHIFPDRSWRTQCWVAALIFVIGFNLDECVSFQFPRKYEHFCWKYYVLKNAFFFQMNISWATTTSCPSDSTPCQAPSVVDFEWDFVFASFFCVIRLRKNDSWNQLWKRSQKIYDFSPKTIKSLGENVIQPPISTYRRAFNTSTPILICFSLSRPAENPHHRIGKILWFQKVFRSILFSLRWTFIVGNRTVKPFPDILPMKNTTSVWTGILFLRSQNDFSKQSILYFQGNYGEYKIFKISLTNRLIPAKASVPCKTPSLPWTVTMLLSRNKNKSYFSNIFGNMFKYFRFPEFSAVSLPEKHPKMAFVPFFFRQYWNAYTKIPSGALLPGVCTRGRILQFSYKLLRDLGTFMISMMFFFIGVQKSNWKTAKTYPIQTEEERSRKFTSWWIEPAASFISRVNFSWKI